MQLSYLSFFKACLSIRVANMVFVLLLQLNEQTMILTLQAKADLASISEEDKIKIMQLAEILPSAPAAGTTHSLEILPPGDDDAMEVDQGPVASSSKKRAPQESGSAKPRKPRVKQTAARRVADASQTKQTSKNAKAGTHEPTVEESQAFMDAVVGDDEEPLENLDHQAAESFLDQNIGGGEDVDAEDFDEDDYNGEEYDEEEVGEKAVEAVDETDNAYQKWLAANRNEDDDDE
jgi:hypothetical protein